MKKPLLTTQPDAIVARLNELNEDKVETSAGSGQSEKDGHDLLSYGKGTFIRNLSF